MCASFQSTTSRNWASECDPISHRDIESYMCVYWVRRTVFFHQFMGLHRPYLQCFCWSKIGSVGELFFFFWFSWGKKRFFLGSVGLRQTINFVMPHFSSYLRYMLMFSSAVGKILAAIQTEVVWGFAAPCRIHGRIHLHSESWSWLCNWKAPTGIILIALDR